MWGWAKIPPDGDTKDARAVETLPRVVYGRGRRADRPTDAFDVLWESVKRSHKP